MKNRLVLLLLILGVIISCSKDNYEYPYRSKESIPNVSLVTRSISDFPKQKSTLVKQCDVDAYVHYKQLSSKSEFAVKKIEPLIRNEQTFGYLIHYSNSWEVISSDKRQPIVLAYGDGILNLDSQPGIFFWLESIAQESLFSSLLPDTSYDADQNLLFWGLINGETPLINNIVCNRESGPDTLFHPVPGHYELHDVIIDEIVTASIPHLIQTNWHQGAPYNRYCPIDSSYFDFYYSVNGEPYEGPLPKCLAGCVAVAGGQVVKYYHDNADCCPAVYSSAFCNTREYPYSNFTLMGQTNKAESNWNYFTISDSTRMAAILLASIGKGTNMKYSSLASRTSLIWLQNFLLDEYELESYYFVFDSVNFNLYDYLESLLIEGYPSIIDAGVDDTTSRHAFIVDRYKKSYNQTTYYYDFIPDNPNLNSSMFEQVVYWTESPVYTYFGMKWGYGNFDNSFFLKNGSWHYGNIPFTRKKYALTFKCDGEVPGQNQQ